MNKMIYLVSNIQPWAIFLIVVALFAVIGGVSFLIYFLTRKKDVQETKPSEDKAAEETLNMYLEDVDDEETKKEFEKYNEENKNK